ncbi:MAG: DUF3604 domain-containing protein [Myxococcota bacterium]
MKALRAVASSLLILTTCTETAGGFERTEVREPCAGYAPLRRPFFGDTHVHTRFSFDAWVQGTRVSPGEAYRFARGEPLSIQPLDPEGFPTRRIRLRRPLDFAVVTDHAEMLGETQLCQTPEAPGHDSLICALTRRWPALGYMIVNSQMLDVRDPRRYRFCGESGRTCLEAAARPWKEIQEAAEAAYDRSAVCAFTSFVGYEWSASPDSKMIHRNIIFRNAIVPEQPASYLEQRTPEALWASLRRDCLERGNGCDVLAIPHNSNLSAGLMFQPTTSEGHPLTREEAERRASLEVLVEVLQHKGDSECRPGGATADELCAFEKLPFARMSESVGRWAWTEPPAGIYVREALAEGLRQQERIGANPFRLGLIGSTDTHLGTPGLAEEDRFVGHAAGRVTHRLESPPLPDSIYFNPGGLAVVWAEENSRDALFEAMRRREVYGTSGPRMIVRFFGGWELPEDLCESHRFVELGYAHGVPMGGELVPPEGAPRRTPRFAVWALRDPGPPEHTGAQLQRIQIIKLEVINGRTHERVFEVTGDPSSGAGVDLETCQRTGPGHSSLCAVWSDPEFEPAAPALYYARVIENPSCRWNRYVCLRAGVDCEGSGPPKGLETCCDPKIPRTIQERAWTSPIWYTPLPRS